MSRKAIPTVLRIDIEPDDFINDGKVKDWNGFVGYSIMIDKLRKQMHDLTGIPFTINWHLRCDPDIERLYGRADYAAIRHEDIFDRLISSKDEIGIHIHDHRWDEKNQQIYSDFSDKEWMNHCLRSSFETFTACFNKKPKFSSTGGYFLSDERLKTLAELGIEVDTTPEPGLRATIDISQGEYATEPSPDYTHFPRKPYYPSLQGMHIPSMSDDDMHKVLLVPLTSFDYFRAQESWPRRMAKKIIGKKATNHRPLSPWRDWPSPKVYWDYVEQAMNEQANPYFATALRTSSPDSIGFKRVMNLLEYLPSHPIAKRLHFVDAAGPEIRDLV
jgi:hypothetical protein